MNIAIIGCGLIGQKRAASVGQNRITWVADLQIERAKALASSLGPAKCTADWREVIVAEDVDAIVVATTHDVLTTISVEAVRAGKHVLVEKPVGRTSIEIEPLVVESMRRGTIVKVGFNHRYHPALLRAKEIVDSGALGQLMFIRGRYGHGGRIGYEKEWRANKEIAGGGELIDQGIHLIDLSRWILGDFIHVDGFLSTYFWDMKVEDNVFMALRTSMGQMAWLHASCTEWKNLFCYEIYGRNGKLQIDGLGGSYGREKLTYYKMLPSMGPPQTTVFEYRESDSSWALEFDEFIEAIRSRREPSGNLRDANAALLIVDKLYERMNR